MRARLDEGVAVEVGQRTFASALLDCSLPAPSQCAGRSAARVKRGFDVYRNNVFASLSAALLAKFPVATLLVGETFAVSAARLFVERYPPKTPVMLWYGAEFPDFLADFEPARTVPYLADVARIEWAVAEAASAADTTPVTAAVLAALAPSAVGTAKLRLHPAVRVVASQHPALSIWRAHAGRDSIGPISVAAASETALIVRPALEVRVERLPPGAAAFVRASGRGAAIDAAIAEAFASSADFDLSGTLITLFASGAVAGSRSQKASQNRRTAAMRDVISKYFDVCKGIPDDLIAYIARLAIGTTFFRSGMLKLEGWSSGNTLALFQDEYKLPLLSPEAAAYIATAAELTLPILIFSGLLTRFAALGLLAMTLTIEIFVYPNAFDTHGLWAVALLFLMKHGPGAISIDTLIDRVGAWQRAQGI